MMMTQSEISVEDSVTRHLTGVSFCHYCHYCTFISYSYSPSDATCYGLVHRYDSSNYRNIHGANHPYCESVISADVFYRSANKRIFPRTMESLKLIRRLALSSRIDFQ